MNIGEPKEVREIEPIATPVPGPVKVPEGAPIQPVPAESPEPVPRGLKDIDSGTHDVGSPDVGFN